MCDNRAPGARKYALHSVDSYLPFILSNSLYSSYHSMDNSEKLISNDSTMAIMGEETKGRETRKIKVKTEY